MTTKFTSNENNLELDLSNYNFTFIEENNLLSQQNKSKYTYPLEFELTPQQIRALKAITHINSTNRNSLINGLFETLGEVHEAVFEIESFSGNRVQGQIRYGYEDFPNFDKELNQLPLEKFDLTNSIYDHAASIVTQNYPQVNYNFPKIITDRLDLSSEQWEHFQGFINNYSSGSFVQNTFDSANNIQYNRNVIQPLPYVLHIIERGFADKGYTLEGEILSDPDFKSMLEYRFSDFYSSFNTQSLLITLNSNEYHTLDGAKGIYEKIIPNNTPGRYKLAGNHIFRTSRGYGVIVATVVILAGNDVVYLNTSTSHLFNNSYKETPVFVDFNFDQYADFDLKILVSQLGFGVINENDIFEEAPISDFTLSQLTKFDSQGNPQATLITPTSINLSKCVPDMKFGDYVTAYLNWKNYGIDVSGNTVTINKVKNLVNNTNNYVSLEDFEVLDPPIKTNQSKSFELKFFEFDSSDYNYKSVLINNEGYSIAPYKKPDDCKEIIINAVPLPISTKDGVITAFDFIDDSSKSKAVFYDGLQATENTTKTLNQLLIPSVYVSEHEGWLDFLLSSLSFSWNFQSSFEKLSKLKVKSIIYAYKQYHVIKTLRRKVIDDVTLEYEIESETLE